VETLGRLGCSMTGALQLQTRQVCSAAWRSLEKEGQPWMV
jgi:hypothetical protein